MRLLADENFPLPAVAALRLAGHDVLTLDKDFRQIAIQRRKPLERSGVILLRVHPAIPENVTPHGAPRD